MDLDWDEIVLEMHLSPSGENAIFGNHDGGRRKASRKSCQDDGAKTSCAATHLGPRPVATAITFRLQRETDRNAFRSMGVRRRSIRCRLPPMTCMSACPVVVRPVIMRLGLDRRSLFMMMRVGIRCVFSSRCRHSYRRRRARRRGRGRGRGRRRQRQRRRDNGRVHAPSSECRSQRGTLFGSRLAREERRCKVDADGRQGNQLGGEPRKKEHAGRLPRESTRFHLV